jgi:epoxyqueuosine reductase
MTGPADLIKQQAIALGFSAVGIARADVLREEEGRLKEWIDRGYQGSMHWMERDRDRRTNPSLIVPNAQSVICVALNYYTPVRHSDENGDGKISRYAWGDDYHDILVGKLKQLWKWLGETYPGVEGRYYVDTGPVMDKVWAQRAGIGWIAKHTNVITQEFGSWVFLGELITTLDLTPDAPATDHCGTCTLCVEACPTDALSEPYVLDANKCISYLTIEHKGAFAGDALLPFENWIYGCDICQDVCPWNQKFSQETSEKEFAPREWNVAPRLEEWTTMSQEDFSKKFKGSPIKRTKREGLTRNVEYVLKQQTGNKH